MAINKYINFVTSRAIGTLVDTLFLWLLSSYIFSSYIGQYIVAPTISFEIAVFTNFLLSYYWVWSSRILEKNKISFIRRFVVFNISCIFGFVIKMLFLLFFERLFGLDVVFCNLMALMISGIVNYILAEFVVFKKQLSKNSM